MDERGTHRGERVPPVSGGAVPASEDHVAREERIVRDPDMAREERDVTREERDVTREERDVTREERITRDMPRDMPRGIDADTMAAARRRQREEFGGINWGAALFGFLAAAGLGAILTGLVSAAGATLTLGTNAENTATSETIGLAGGIALLVVLVAAYFAGGYVAGRMSRFDGARQGMGVWLVALAVTVILAAAGAILGGEFNVLERLNLPRIPVDEGDLATGGLIALVVGVLGSLLAAMAGGKSGERYHRKIDRLAVDR